MLRRHLALLIAVAAIVLLHGLAVLAVWWIDRDPAPAGAEVRTPAAPALAVTPARPPARPPPGPRPPPPIPRGGLPLPAPPPMDDPYLPPPVPSAAGSVAMPPPDPAVVEAAPVWHPGDPQFDPSPAATAEADAFARHQAEMQELLDTVPPPSRPASSVSR